MSEIEFERADQEAMDLVNRTANQEAAESAEQIANEWEKQQQAKFAAEFEKAAKEAEEKEREAARRFHRKMRWGLALRLAVCAVIATGLIVAMFVPEAIVWIANVGILACGMVWAVSVDRYFRWR